MKQNLWQISEMKIEAIQKVCCGSSGKWEVNIKNSIILPFIPQPSPSHLHCYGTTVFQVKKCKWLGGSPDMEEFIL